MYGARSHAAGREILANTMIVARMASQRKMMSISAVPGLCRPKKMTDQSVFKTS